MFQFLVILFIIKLNAQANVLQNINKKHGQDKIRVVGKLEDLINKYRKEQLDVNSIMTCKREDLIPTFTKATVSIEYGTQKLKMKIARAVMETEMEDKHDQKRKIQKQFRDIKFQLKSSSTLILYNTLLDQINIAVKSTVKAITTRHLNKLSSLCNRRSTYSKNVNHTSFIKSTVYNTLTEDEYIALAFGLDHHIPARTNKNIIDTEFELYFQGLIIMYRRVARS